MRPVIMSPREFCDRFCEYSVADRALEFSLDIKRLPRKMPA